MRLAIVTLALVACTRPSEERALEELAIGQAARSGISVRVDGGLAAIRELADGRLELWAGAPAIALELSLDATTAGEWTIVARNTLPDAELVFAGVRTPRLLEDPLMARPTVATFRVTLPAGDHRLAIEPPDARTVERYHVAAMADIQTALPEVDDVFTAISAVPEARFVVAMGDLTERAEQAEYDLFERQLEYLTVPFYTTLGNHELWSEPQRFFGRFGRASFSFSFKGTAFTFADTGDAGIDPLVESWVVDWIAAAGDQPHIFLTHIPPIDPVGVRYGAFRSTRDGHRLLSRLADGGVDLTLYGHIHTFDAFENAGIPAYISGGGGALPMKWDGIDRHFLLVELTGDAIGEVTVMHVD
jgi:Icc protein